MRDSLKVYGVTLHGGAGQERVIVAAKSQKQAVELINAQFGRVSLHYFRGFGAETGNKVEVGVALNKPFTVFSQPLNQWDAPFTEVQRRKIK